MTFCRSFLPERIFPSATCRDLRPTAGRLADDLLPLSGRPLLVSAFGESSARQAVPTKLQPGRLDRIARQLCGSISRHHREYNNRAAWIPEKRTQRTPNLKNRCLSARNSALPQMRHSGITQPSLSSSLCRTLKNGSFNPEPQATVCVKTVACDSGLNKTQHFVN